MRQRLRAFIALELPPEVRGELGQLQSKLKAQGGNLVTWVRVEGIHLTLKFLGGVAPEQLLPIQEALAAIAPGSAPLRLELTGTGIFPSPQRPRVLWVGLEGESDRLLRLQQQIEQALIPLGFAAEARPFSAHLTLARVRETAPAELSKRFGQAALAIPVEKVSFQLNSLVLMESQLSPGGAIYTTLARFSLGSS